jgi:hypothetical protein
MKQTLSFSFSRKSTFDSCQRQYYLNYYGSKNGWFKSASNRTKQIYALKKLSNIYTWAGNVVHDTIEWILKNLRDNQKTIGIEEAKIFAKNMIKSQYIESQNRQSMYNSNEWGYHKLFGLKEHAFKEGVSPSQRSMVLDRVNSCLQNFFSSEIFQEILNSDITGWKSIENFSTFNVQLDSGFQLPVFSVPDFAMKSGDKLYIYDWKTGKPSPKYKKQLSLYAVYAERFWDVKPEDIICKIFYLLKNTVDIVDVSRDTINKMISDVKTGASEMIEKLTDKNPVKNEALPEDNFPLTDNTGDCFFCTFSDVCGIKNKR